MKGFEVKSLKLRFEVKGYFDFGRRLFSFHGDQGHHLRKCNIERMNVIIITNTQALLCSSILLSFYEGAQRTKDTRQSLMPDCAGVQF